MAPVPDNQRGEAGMIIDCHGHYTTAPGEFEAWRKAQTAAFESRGSAPAKSALKTRINNAVRVRRSEFTGV